MDKETEEIQSKERAVLILECIKRAVKMVREQTYKPKYISIDGEISKPIDPWRK